MTVHDLAVGKNYHANESVARASCPPELPQVARDVRRQKEGRRQKAEGRRQKNFSSFILHSSNGLRPLRPGFALEINAWRLMSLKSRLIPAALILNVLYWLLVGIPFFLGYEWRGFFTTIALMIPVLVCAILAYSQNGIWRWWLLFWYGILISGWLSGQPQPISLTALVMFLLGTLHWFWKPKGMGVFTLVPLLIFLALQGLAFNFAAVVPLFQRSIVSPSGARSLTVKSFTFVCIYDVYRDRGLFYERQPIAQIRPPIQGKCFGDRFAYVEWQWHEAETEVKWTIPYPYLPPPTAESLPTTEPTRPPDAPLTGTIRLTESDQRTF
jgi:hypothetical protein